MTPERLVEIAIQKKLRSSVLSPLFIMRGSCLMLVERVPRLQLGPRVAKRKKDKEVTGDRGTFGWRGSKKEKTGERCGGQTEIGSVRKGSAPRSWGP